MAGKISGKAFVQDIRDGMNRKALMVKYGVSARRLDAMFNKVVEAGVLKKSALPGAASASTPGRAGERKAPLSDPGATAGKVREGSSGLQMMDSSPQAIDNRPPPIDNTAPPIDDTPPVSGVQTPADVRPIESGKGSRKAGKSRGFPSGVGDIIGGGVLICIGLAMGGSVFTGDATIIDWFFDILGAFWICRGVYRLIKK